MAQKKHIFLALALLALIGSIALSLKRSKSVDNPSGEIKHFSTQLVARNLRLRGGMTLEDFIDQHILIGNRIHRRSHAPQSDTGTWQTKPMQKPNTMLTHEVTWGDSLAKLAKQYSTTPYKIAQLNQIAEDAVLKIGQKIRILPAQPSTYRVRPGDNLTTIARCFGVDRRAIEHLNGLDAARPIWVGQKLMLPVAQKKIDAFLAEIQRKEHQRATRQKHYQHKLFLRIAEQKRRRKIAEARARAAQKAKKARALRSRREKARRIFKETGSKHFKHKIRVAATAYTSHRSQTDSTPFLAAWNNRIRPGMKIIAVSPDLIRRYGITNGVRVKIGGLPGTYVVRDKMNPRLHNHIDIYMGTNRRRALRWGRRRVMLYW